MKRLRSTSAGQWWLVWVSGGRKWVLGSSKAVNAAYLAVFDPSTNSALSRQLESAQKKNSIWALSARRAWEVQTLGLAMGCTEADTWACLEAANGDINLAASML